MKKSKNPSIGQKTPAWGGSSAAKGQLLRRLNCPMHSQEEYFPYSPSNKVTVEYSGRYAKKLHKTYGGRLVKQGRLAAPGPKLTYGFDSEFSKSNDFVLGGPGRYKTVTKYGAPAPNGKSAPSTKPFSSAVSTFGAPCIRPVTDGVLGVNGPSVKKGEIDDDNDGRESEKNSASDSKQKSPAIGLHESKVNLNLKIGDLGPDFKKKKLFERLKLLELERGIQGKEEPSAVRIKEDSNTEIRACSTCKNSLDLLECSMADNQRKSFAKWLARDEEDIEKAYRTLGSSHELSLTPESKEIPIFNEIRSSSDRIKNLGADFKQKRILERLKLMKLDKENKTAQLQGDEDENDVHACSTCRSSLDFLECSKKDNQRKSIAKWLARDEADIDKAFKTLGSKQNSQTSIMKIGETDSDSVFPSRDEPVLLHQSKVAINLKIKDLGDDFKHKRILDRLKLLKQDRENNSIHEKLHEDEDENDDSGVRACSTCRNSLDLLECSKKDNQKKSIAKWMARDEADIDKAFKKILGSEQNSEISLDKPRIKTAESDSDSALPSRDEPVSLHLSKTTLKLKIKNLGDDFKQKRILDRLKLLKTDRGNQLLEATDSEEEDDDENTSLRACSTCRTSIDLLECSKKGNQRKSIARWQARESSDINSAISDIEDQLDEFE